MRRVTDCRKNCLTINQRVVIILWGDDMAKQDTDFYENFTKNVYETIKGLSDDRGEYVIHTYENLYGKLKTEGIGGGSVHVDLAKLREDLSHVRGIGGQRLDEIMAVIERHLTPGEHREPEIGRADGEPEAPAETNEKDK